MMTTGTDAFGAWVATLEARYLADLEFAEVSRALRALSSAYIERRHVLRRGAALSGAGKRAAFALFYGPLHFLTVRYIVEQRSLDGSLGWMIDLGCGTGAAGAAWASTCSALPHVVGVDVHPWALDEAQRTYRHFHLDAEVRRGDASAVRLARGRGAVVAAFTVNELTDEQRTGLLERLRERIRNGVCVLIVEPVARSAAPWWKAWQREFEDAGGRADEWRFRAELPAIVAKLDRAAGLDHREIIARSLVVG